MNTQYNPAITELLNEMQLSSLEQARQYCLSHHIDAQALVLDTQPIAFESAAEAYTLGAALAIYRGATTAEQAALIIGEGLQAVTKPGSVAHQRQVGLGHGALAARLLNEQSQCFAFLAGHESFAAAEGAIKIALNVNKSRHSPLKVILNGLGKDAAYLISRINGFTYVRTQYDYQTGELHEVERRQFSQGPRSDILCYGADDVREGVAIMHKEQVDVSITGNSTNPTRFQHPVAGIYKAERNRLGLPYFSVASGGGTGRTLHPDNVAAGPASYGMTDTLGRMHADAQFAGSSSVPAHVAMMGFIGMGNNPMVGATVALAVAVAQREAKAA
ncbi:GGGtGRT protein [Vibrio intestinalis]|uniref:GGGtGRT protein n=1 Tax=Vibrio intestinalis TaxID=2933291 RepID=UPI0021A78EF6|nr:GGGtGRT protein [Vibrio intestinalis]